MTAELIVNIKTEKTIMVINYLMMMVRDINARIEIETITRDIKE